MLPTSLPSDAANWPNTRAVPASGPERAVMTGRASVRPFVSPGSRLACIRFCSSMIGAFMELSAIARRCAAGVSAANFVGFICALRPPTAPVTPLRPSLRTPRPCAPSSARPGTAPRRPTIGASAPMNPSDPAVATDDSCANRPRRAITPAVFWNFCISFWRLPTLLDAPLLFLSARAAASPRPSISIEAARTSPANFCASSSLILIETVLSSMSPGPVAALELRTRATPARRVSRRLSASRLTRSVVHVSEQPVAADALNGRGGVDHLSIDCGRVSARSDSVGLLSRRKPSPHDRPQVTRERIGRRDRPPL